MMVRVMLGSAADASRLEHDSANTSRLQYLTGVGQIGWDTLMA
jgi:hypothetical protein